MAINRFLILLKNKGVLLLDTRDRQKQIDLNSLLDEFFQIDQKVLEAEREEMIKRKQELEANQARGGKFGDTIPALQERRARQGR